MAEPRAASEPPEGEKPDRASDIREARNTDVHYLGLGAAKRLETIPLYTATELLEYASERGEHRHFVARAVANAKEIAAGAFEVQLGELRSDPNVRHLLGVKRAYGSY